MHRYTPADLQWLIKNLKEKGYQSAADHFGVNLTSMKVAVTRMRKWEGGHLIPYLKSLDIGTVTMRTLNGKTEAYHKVGKAKWLRVKTRPAAGRPPKEKKVKELKPKVVKVVVVKESKLFIEKEAKIPKPRLDRGPVERKTFALNANFKRVEKAIPTRKETRSMKLVRVNKSTLVEAPVTDRDQDVIDRYYARFDKK